MGHIKNAVAVKSAIKIAQTTHPQKRSEPMKDSTCPEDRISQADLMTLCKAMLPFWPEFEAMLSGGPFELPPALSPEDRINHSNEMIVRELTGGIEKGLYTCIRKTRNSDLAEMFTNQLWKAIRANLDIACPHGIAIRDGGKIVRLSRESDHRGLFSLV